MKAKYIYPFTEFGFKKIFAEESSKPQLFDFLNSLLPQANQINKSSFMLSNCLWPTDTNRKSLFALECMAENGKMFIVNLQIAKHNLYKKRSDYFSTFPTQKKADAGKWNNDETPAFCIGILDFTFGDYETMQQKNEWLHSIKHNNQPTHIYLEMPNFKKTESELETRLDKWLYFIKHLEDFQNIPEVFNDDIIFINLFERIEVPKYKDPSWETYERSLKDFRDLTGIINWAYDQGKLEGIKKANTECP